MIPNRMSSHQRKVLIVEDEPEMRQILREVLEEDDWDVTIASSVESARAFLVQTDWSCILLDLHLSDGSADELEERLKTFKIQPPELRPTVILMTGVPETHEQNRLHGTIDATLLKPFAIAELLALLPGTPGAHAR